MKTTLLSLLLFTSMNLIAKEGGNGGQGVYSGQNLFLRDVVEKNNCIWKTPSMIKEHVPSYAALHKNLEEKILTFAIQLDYNFNSVSFCFTDRKLIPLNYNNSDDLYSFPNSNYEQIAIFDKEVVFINNQLFSKLNPKNKAFTILHEVSHQFYDFKVQKREETEPRLRQFILNMSEQVDYLDYDLMTLLYKESKFTYIDIINEENEEVYSRYFSNKDLPLQWGAYIKLKKEELKLNSKKSLLFSNNKDYFSELLSSVRKDLDKHKTEVGQRILLYKINGVDLSSYKLLMGYISSIGHVYKSILDYVVEEYGDDISLDDYLALMKNDVSTDSMISKIRKKLSTADISQVEIFFNSGFLDHWSKIENIKRMLSSSTIISDSSFNFFRRMFDSIPQLLWLNLDVILSVEQNKKDFFADIIKQKKQICQSLAETSLIESLGQIFTYSFNEWNYKNHNFSHLDLASLYLVLNDTSCSSYRRTFKETLDKEIYYVQQFRCRKFRHNIDRSKKNCKLHKSDALIELRKIKSNLN